MIATTLRQRRTPIKGTDNTNNSTDQLRKRPKCREIPPERVFSVLSSSSMDLFCWLLTPASQVLDPDETTMWNSRSFAPAWIRLDLGMSAPCVCKVELLPSMEPREGLVEHRIKMGMHLSSLESVVTISGECKDRRWIQISLPQSRRTRFLEIFTVHSPSWVAWVRIRVWVEF
jgi:hypothetical protein